jgi:hypothetical protein
VQAGGDLRRASSRSEKEEVGAKQRHARVIDGRLSGVITTLR